MEDLEDFICLRSVSVAIERVSNREREREEGGFPARRKGKTEITWHVE